MANVDFPVEDAVCQIKLEDFLESATGAQDVVEKIGLEGFGAEASVEEVVELLEALDMGGLAEIVEVLEDEETEIEDVVEVLGLDGFGESASEDEIVELVEALGLEDYVVNELYNAYDCGHGHSESDYGFSPEECFDMTSLICMRRI